MKKITLTSAALISMSVLLASLTLWRAALWGRKRWAIGTEKIRSELASNCVSTETKFFHAQELDDLPAPVQRYFQAVLTDGQPIITAASFDHKGLLNERDRHELEVVHLHATGRYPPSRQARFSNYVLRDGMRVPLKGEVAWVLPDGEKAHFRAKITSLAYEFAQ